MIYANLQLALSPLRASSTTTPKNGFLSYRILDCVVPNLLEVLPKMWK